jgi:hypothetical protein
MISREYQEACAFHDWLTVKGLFHWHTANESGGNARRGAMNKRMGVRAGIPDFFIVVPPVMTSGTTLYPQRLIAVELKIKGGKISPEQNKVLGVLSASGVKCCVAYGWQEAKKFVEENL